MNKIPILCAIIILSGLTGCTVIQEVEQPQGHYYINPAVNFSNIGQIAVLELDDESTSVNRREKLTRALADVLVKTHLFSVETIDDSDPEWEGLNLDDIEHYSYQQLGDIRKELGVDAVVYGEICQYSSYPHFLMHLRIKMVSLYDGKLIWAIEEIWDGKDKKVAQRMETFYNEQIRTGYQPMNWQIMITSPQAFVDFVFYEVGQTLPKVYTSQNSRLSSENMNNFSQNLNFEKKNGIFSVFY